MLSLVSVPVPELQPVARNGWTPEKRARLKARAERNFEIFELKFRTKTGISRRALRAVYAAHADRRLTETLLVFAWNCRWPAWRIHQLTKSLGLKRCASSTMKCWLHQAMPTAGIPHTEVNS